MEYLGKKNRLIHRKITSITLALLLGAGGIETVAGWFVLVCRTVLRPSAPSLARFPPSLGSRFVGVRPPS